MYKINLHAHSHFSDGLNSITEMAAEYKRLGFCCCVITDHVYTKDEECSLTYKKYKYQVKEAQAITYLGFPTIIGIELSVKEAGEEIVVFGEPAIKTIFKLRERYNEITVKQLLAIKRHNKNSCLFNLCHPSSSAKLLELGGFELLDCYELINSGHEFFTKEENPYRSLIALCNSDAHAIRSMNACHNEITIPIEHELELIAYFKSIKKVVHVNSRALDKSKK